MPAYPDFRSGAGCPAADGDGQYSRPTRVVTAKPVEKEKSTATKFSFGDAVVYDNAIGTMVAAGANTPHGYVSEYAGAVAGSTEVSVILI